MTEWTPENQPAASIYTEPNRPGSAYNPAISIYGVNPRGAWSGVANYVERDTVTYQGSQWRALRANLNVIPVEGADWTLFASKGADSTMAVGVVTTGAPGTNAIITNSGTASAAIWNFTIPRGDTGAQGPQGIQGPVGPPAGSPLSLISNAAAEIPLTIKGAAGQTANLQEWRNSADSIRGRITAAGNVHWGGDGTDATLDSGSTFHIVARSAGGKPLTVRGAASQTANLQEWQNDAGTVLTRIASSGGMVMPSGSIIGATHKS